MPKGEPAKKAPRPPRTYGTGAVQPGPRPGTWYLRYTPKGCRRLGKLIEAPDRKSAEDALTAWRQDLDKQHNPGVKVPCSYLFDLHLADMRRRQRNGKNILDQEAKIRKHLIPFFGSREAASIQLTDINAYVDQRLKERAAPATINRELSNLRKAFRCGFEENRILAPLAKYKRLPENNIREGFLEHDDYRRIMNHLPAHQHLLWCFAYYLGIRKGELLKFRWDWLLPYWKQKMPIVKIPGKFTKNGKPHTIPLYHPEMRAMIEIALVHREPSCPFLFQYQGRQLKSIRTGFEKACHDAGLEEVIFHDTRRTAIRNMVRASISEKRAMQISGHSTRSVFDRYDITTERDAIDTGDRLEKHWAERAEKEAERASESAQSGYKSGYEPEATSADTGCSIPAKRLN